MSSRDNVALRVETQRAQSEHNESDSPPKADVGADIDLRRFVPKAAASRCSKLGHEKQIFDHLVGGHQQLFRYSEAEHPGGRMVDDQLELRSLHNRQVRRLDALEDASGIEAELTPCVRNIGSVAH